LTVGQIAAQSPLSIRVFERHQIDFCCGGNQPLSQACVARGLDPAEILDEIDGEAGTAAEADGEIDWKTASLNSLIDHIISTHHVYMKTQLPRMGAMLEKIVAKHSDRYGEVLQVAATFSAMREELEGHLMKEEMILFPLIRRMEEARRRGQAIPASHCGSVQNPIRVMVMEHDSAGEGLGELRRLTNGYAPPEDACNTFRALYAEMAVLERDLHQHIHLENNILFPRAVELEAE
jgi:regulator of cell morphogenesis and NO signaling